MDAGAWWGYSPWGRKESDTTEQLYFHFSLAVIFIISCMIALRSEINNDCLETISQQYCNFQGIA